MNTVSSIGTVRFWKDAEGWGVIDSSETPGGCWAFMDTLWKVTRPELQPGEVRESGGGFRALVASEEVDFEWECPPGGQDGYAYRATGVWPRRPAPESAGS